MKEFIYIRKKNSAVDGKIPNEMFIFA